MTREAFKQGFIKQCRDEGLTNEGQVLARISQLIVDLEKRAASPADILNSLGQQMAPSLPQKPSDQAGERQSPWPVMVAGGIGLPFAAGAGLGILGSKLKGNWLDEGDVHQQELIDELRRQTALARQYSRLGGASPSSF